MSDDQVSLPETVEDVEQKDEGGPFAKPDLPTEPASPEKSDTGQGEADLEPTQDADDADSSAQKGDGSTEGEQDTAPDPQLLAAAVQHGLSEQAATVLAQSGDLEATLATMDRQAFQAPVQQQQPQQQPMQPVQQQEQQQTPALEPYKLEIDPEYFDEKSRAAMEGMNAHYQGLMQQQQAQHVDQEQRLQAMQATLNQIKVQRETERSDVMFAGLEKNFGSAFGKGPFLGLPPNSAQATARQDAWAMAQHMEDAHIQRGQNPPPFASLLERAARALTPDETAKRVRKDMSDQLRDQDGTFTTKPQSKPMKDSRNESEQSKDAMLAVAEQKGLPWTQ